GVLTDRRAVAHADHNVDFAGVLGVEREGLHFADLQALKADTRSRGQPSYRAVEHNVVAFAAACEIAHPKHEDEGKGEDAQHKSPDHQIVGFGFHPTGSSNRLWQQRLGGNRYLRPFAWRGRARPLAAEILLDPRVIGLALQLRRRAGADDLLV